MRLSETSTHTEKPRHTSTARFLEQGRFNGLRNAWIRLLRNIRDKGHGGSLFVFSPPNAASENDSIDIKYPVTMQNFANVARERGEWDGMYHDLWLRKQNGNLTKKEEGQFDAFLNEVFLNDKRLAHLTDAIAAMATVDGAVLFSSDLDILGFGTRIRLRSEISGEVDQLSVSRGKSATASEA